MLKKITYLLLLLLSVCYKYSYGLITENDIDPRGESILDVSLGDTSDIDKLTSFTTGAIFTMLWIIVVGSFIYIGFKFVTARGNPEEFKKAWTNVIYTIVGILMVSGAWAMVRLVAGIDF